MPNEQSQSCRIIRDFTAEERQRWLQARADANAELPDMLAKRERLAAAAGESSLSGAIRQAIHRAPVSLAVLAQQAGIEIGELDDFLVGRKALTSDVLDRIAQQINFVYSTAKLPIDVAVSTSAPSATAPSQ